MIRGLFTVTYRVPDLAEAKAWYARAFGTAPYFDEPFYVGFDVNGYELGLMPEEGEHRAGAGGSIAYWGVTGAAEALAHVLALGAVVHDPVRDVGGGILIGSVRDPYGNVIGLVENPHFGNG